jgi:chemotaxis protein CheY-P-specific phosphatase CheC
MIESAATPLARDALKELISIGSGNALTSLNRMLGRGCISLSLPQYVPGNAAGDIEGLQRVGMGVHLVVKGEIACTFLALFDDASAKRLAGLLLDYPVEELGGLEESALLELVNIISCSFLGALGTMVRGVLIPSPPAAAYGRLADLVRIHARGTDVVVLTTEFHDAAVGFSGRIVVLTEDHVASAMLSAVGVA